MGNHNRKKIQKTTTLAYIVPPQYIDFNYSCSLSLGSFVYFLNICLLFLRLGNYDKEKWVF